MKITSKIYYALFKYNKNFKIRKINNYIIDIIIRSPKNNFHYVYEYDLNSRNILIPEPTIKNLKEFPKIGNFINLIKTIYEKIK